MIKFDFNNMMDAYIGEQGISEKEIEAVLDKAQDSYPVLHHCRPWGDTRHGVQRICPMGLRHQPYQATDVDYTLLQRIEYLRQLAAYIRQLGSARTGAYRCGHIHPRGACGLPLDYNHHLLPQT